MKRIETLDVRLVDLIVGNYLLAAQIKGISSIKMNLLRLILFFCLIFSKKSIQ